MSNILPADRIATRRGVLGLLSASVVTRAMAAPSDKPPMPTLETLTDKQLAIGPVTASAAAGRLAELNTALDDALDTGLTVSEAREMLIQVYAYAGFPRALNALGELMKVLDARRGRGIVDAPGREPSPVPGGDALLALGTANQTKLSGGPVQGPLFDFAPAINQFLRAHLFGAVFARDNLDWPSRELATLGALSAMPGVEQQLLAHLRIGMNVGLTEVQLSQFADALSVRGATEAGQRMRAALDTHLNKA